MMEKAFSWIIEHAPWYVVTGIVVFVSIVKWGPQFIKTWSDTIHEINERNKLPLTTYITELKMQIKETKEECNVQLKMRDERIEEKNLKIEELEAELWKLRKKKNA